MAPGRAHDRATTLLALPFGLLWGPGLGVAGVAVASLAFLVGGLWLSPDLDTHSRATARWGPLRPLWWPYRRLLRHRSLMSHSPVLGSAGRLAYLLGALALLSLLLGAAPGPPLPLPPPGAWPGLAEDLWRSHPRLVLCGLAGLEASSWLHLLQDGDPLPRPPRALRWLVKRLRAPHGPGRRSLWTRRPIRRQRGR
ncbi:MAG: metal-binding protein [Cyanobacteriota bacterium]|nr:metal-binding protein [Cyanobacteriota bacterium]